MKAQNYWKNYVYQTDAEEIETNLRQATFKARGLNLSLKYFETSKNAPNVLLVVGTGCYSLYLAELGYHIHLRGYNVFGIDFQGHGDSDGGKGEFTIDELVENCSDAAKYISSIFNNRIGASGFSLGGFVTFYLGLTHGPVKSILCQNPGILTERRFQNEVTKLNRIIPIARFLASFLPKMKVPTKRYVDFMGLAETEGERKHVEIYMNDPDIVKHYTLRAAISQISTPPPHPIGELKAATMFLAPTKDKLMSVSYVRDLYDRLPPIKKKFLEVNGGHYWMSSHPREAANVICDWFDETL